GFTGDSGENRKKATGMGLYLAKEIAHDLKLKLEVESEWMQGFEMKIIFPKIDVSGK
ncbi:MAG TPA: sensor histidine kinase, partial [Candidatus Pelethocola excrementipullorum]|nr:sensor histidine kinase [Candidatus Pelethocola excrementipullorum]